MLQNGFYQIEFNEEIKEIDLLGEQIVINGNNCADIPDFSSNIMLNINNKIVVPDALPFILNDRAQVPVRALLENLGATVNFNAEKREVTAVAGENKIVLTLDSQTAYVNNQEIILDSPATISNERTFVPLRFIAENLGFNVVWNSDKRLITVSAGIKEKTPEQEKLLPEQYLDGKGIIQDEETAKNVAFEILNGLGYKIDIIDVTFNDKENVWNIKSPDFGLIMVISKENCKVLEFIEPKSEKRD